MDRTGDPNVVHVSTLGLPEFGPTQGLWLGILNWLLDRWLKLPKGSKVVPSFVAVY